jgi:hypothetical protein
VDLCGFRVVHKELEQLHNKMKFKLITRIAVAVAMNVYHTRV